MSLVNNKLLLHHQCSGPASVTATDVFPAIKTKTGGGEAADERRFERTEDAGRNEDDDEKMEGGRGR